MFQKGTITEADRDVTEPGKFVISRGVKFVRSRSRVAVRCPYCAIPLQLMIRPKAATIYGRVVKQIAPSQPDSFAIDPMPMTFVHLECGDCNNDFTLPSRDLARFTKLPEGAECLIP